MQDDVARQRIESRRWQRVPNSEVRHVWQSDCDEDCESHGDTATVGPNYYQDSGEPCCCTCGNVYSYVQTEVNKT